MSTIQQGSNNGTFQGYACHYDQRGTDNAAYVPVFRRWNLMTDGVDSVSVCTWPGTPESNIVGDIGSICMDSTNGALYMKTTDTVNTGWVLVGPSTGTVASFDIDAAVGPGTDPTLPNGAGQVGVFGVTVANGGIPIQTRAIAANAFRIEAQRAADSTGTNATSQGLASFDDTHFVVDANGYVQLLNGVYVADFNVDAATGPGTDPVPPNASGQITVTGNQVVAGTVGANVIRTHSTAANSYTIEIQRSAAAASSLPVNNGVCHFDSSDFSVDANGFVTLNAGASPWLDSAGGALALNTGYFGTAAAVFTLPTGTANGQTVEIVDVVGGGVVVTAPGVQIIRIGSSASSAGGTCTSTALGDSLRLIFRLADVTWYEVPGSQGTWTLA